jgi:hypothetical protein
VSIFDALATKCGKCGSAGHSTTFCAPRAIAARKLGQGETLEVAAAAAHIRPVLVRHWADVDQEFMGLVARARGRAERR